MIKLWKALALPVFLGFIFLGGYLYFYLGGNKEVTVTEVQIEPINTLYKVHRGAYHKINDTITTVETWAQKNNIPCKRSFGHYLDDPRTVDEVRLKSHGGCILEQPLASGLVLPEGVTLGQIESGTYLRAEFSGSPAIGPWKVYPALEKKAEVTSQKLKNSSVEIYTILPDQKMKTEYLIQIEK